MWTLIPSVYEVGSEQVKVIRQRAPRLTVDVRSIAVIAVERWSVVPQMTYFLTT